MPADITLRDLGSDEAHEPCLELARLTWDEDFRERVPPTVLELARRGRGVVAGASDEADRLPGFVPRIGGLCDGGAHGSHLLAVWREARGLGLGRRLNAFGRARRLECGVYRVERAPLGAEST